LEEHLPGDYVALIDQEVRLVQSPSDSGNHFFPDGLVARSGDGAPGSACRNPGATLLEPVEIPLLKSDQEEVRDSWIEIRRLPDGRLIAVGEILSPTNKSGTSRDDYLKKRDRWIDQPVHLVEIDLLLGGMRRPLRRPYPSGDYFALVSRADRRPICKVYAWGVRDNLPSIPVPLQPPDADVFVDLASLVRDSYRKGRYDRIIKYTEPLHLPLGSQDRAWVEEVAKASTH
jgi:hypothetical protein